MHADVQVCTGSHLPEQLEARPCTMCASLICVQLGMLTSCTWFSVNKCHASGDILRRVATSAATRVYTANAN